MPSAISERNAVVLDYHTTEEESGAEEYFNSEVADDIKPGFYSFANTENYFPEAKLKKEYVPLGAAKPLCIHLDWIPIGKKN